MPIMGGTDSMTYHNVHEKTYQITLDELFRYLFDGKNAGQMVGKLEEIEKTVREKRNSIMGDEALQGFDNRLDSQLEVGTQISLSSLE